MIKPSPCVRDLGVWLDSHLTFKQHVNKVTRSALSYLRVISRQSHYLNDQCTSLLIHSLVFSCIDYCSSLFYNINKCELTKLQGIINYATRVFKKLRKADDVSLVITTLKWPTIKQRIIHRIVCLVYKILCTGQPHSLSEILNLSCPTVNTRRSADTFLLCVPSVKTAFGERSFHRSGATMWNMLPIDVRSSKNIALFQQKSLEYLTSTT